MTATSKFQPTDKPRRWPRLILVALIIILAAIGILAAWSHTSPVLSSRLLVIGIKDRHETLVAALCDRKQTFGTLVKDLIATAEQNNAKLSPQEQAIKRVWLQGMELGAPALLETIFTTYMQKDKFSFEDSLPNLTPFGAALGLNVSLLLNANNNVKKLTSSIHDSFEISDGRAIQTVVIDQDKEIKVVLLWERNGILLWKLVGILNLFSLTK